jgi:hypothetical protein
LEKFKNKETVKQFLFRHGSRGEKNYQKWFDDNAGKAKGVSI